MVIIDKSMPIIKLSVIELSLSSKSELIYKVKKIISNK